MKKIFLFIACSGLAIGLSSCAASVSELSATSEPEETISEAKNSIATENADTPVPIDTASPTPSAKRTEVNWGDYTPGTQGEIDQMAAAGDCLGLQSMFGMATATEESVKARTGHGNEALTKYLNESLVIAGCN